ncbi:MAG: hypothetical protein KRP56_03425 [Candidatus Methanogranum gryphiswaldense]|nr:MAG: hypothetical protein KRP56_03425 [Candidatus Methanogranum sp. U3.2.1]
MTDDVYVVQAVTTGPNGYPYDEIIDIAICKADLDDMNYELVYSGLVFYDPKDLGKKKLDYLSEHFRMTPETIYSGGSEKKISNDILEIIKGHNVTCYDIRQEFGRYMICAPWDITYQTTIMPSISSRMPISLKCKEPADEAETICKAYHRIMRNDPAKVRRNRRAEDLAKMSTHLMFHMREKGKY